MRIPAIWTCTIATLIAGAWRGTGGGIVQAEPLVGATVPEDSRWVMHVDIDGLRASHLLDVLGTRLPAVLGPQGAFLGPAEKESPMVAFKRIQAFANVMGMRWPDGLHDVTLFAATYQDGDACLRIHGEIDPQVTIAFLRTDPEFKQETYNGHTVVTWRDPGANRLVHAAFDKEMVLMSPNSKTVEAALDAWDKRASGLKEGSLLLPNPAAVGSAAISPPQILWMAAQGLAESPDSQNGKSPLLSQMDTASVAMSFDPAGPGHGAFVAQLHVVAKTESAAKQMQAIVEGAKALTALASVAAHAPEKTRMADMALQGLAVRLDGKNVQAEWQLEVDKIEAIVGPGLQKRSGSVLPPKDIP